jgi:hypothetical protein
LRAGRREIKNCEPPVRQRNTGCGIEPLTAPVWTTVLQLIPHRARNPSGIGRPSARAEKSSDSAHVSARPLQDR